MYQQPAQFTRMSGTPTYKGFYTDKKRKRNFLIDQEIQMGSVAKSYLRKDFLIYEEMRKYLTIYEEAVSHSYMTLQPIPSVFPDV
jgi:hypothetical protein